MSLQTIVMDTDVSAVGFQSVCDLSPGQLPALQNLQNYLSGLSGGNQAAILSINVGAVQATATITSTGTATAAQTMTLFNVTLTAVASAPAANQFVVSATPATQAANIAAAINASASFTGRVTATSAAGVVTVRAVMPGVVGNGLQIANVNLGNVTVAGFSGGSNGTSYTLNFQ